MEETDSPMSPLMKVVFWFVTANALVGAVSLSSSPQIRLAYSSGRSIPPSMLLSLGHCTWVERPS
jgi:hypothetical protein